jgi:hypothetical protein
MEREKRGYAMKQAKPAKKSSAAKTLTSESASHCLKDDRFSGNPANLPLWAKLRVAYGMATKEEVNRFNEIADAILERNEAGLSASEKITCAPDTHCLFSALQPCTACTSSCTKTCTSSCTSSCTSNCTSHCLGMPGCMGSVGIVGAR